MVKLIQLQLSPSRMKRSLMFDDFCCTIHCCLLCALLLLHQNIVFHWCLSSGLSWYHCTVLLVTWFSLPRNIINNMTYMFPFRHAQTIICVHWSLVTLKQCNSFLSGPDWTLLHYSSYHSNCFSVPCIQYSTHLP